MGHTKGPWTINESEIDLVQIKSEDKGVALTDKANARLIAAAPEILEVLELCLPIVRREKHSFETDSVQHPTVELILKVIKKAKGE